MIDWLTFAVPFESNIKLDPVLLPRLDQLPVHEVLRRSVSALLNPYSLLGSALTTIWDDATALFRVIEISAIMALSEAPVIVAVPM